MSGGRVALLARIQGLRLARRPWVQAVTGGGVVAAVVIAAASAAESGRDQEDAFRSGGASLLLLAGLVVAVLLGAGALNRDAASGHLGLLVGSGAARAEVAAAAVAARVVALAVVLAAWTVALELGSLALGMGLDGPLAVHALAVSVGLLLTLLAATAASSVVGPVAAGAFGLIVFVTAQAAVNLKAAADQDLIGTARGGADAFYYAAPRTIVSPMISALQARDAGGPAAPSLDINGNEVLVPASGWGSVVWTLLWCALLVVACVGGLRRRPLA
jgi:ABC-type transport system involved in multi-copper enzyme maturation permease subunit